MPDTTGECWAEPYSILATNDRWPYNIFRFGLNNAAQPTVRHGFYGSIVIPQNYANTPVLRILWTSSLTTGDVVWDFDYRVVGGNDTTSLDQTSQDEAVTVTDTAPGAAHRLLDVTINLTSGNFTSSGGKILQFGFFRDGVDAADTLAGAAILHNLLFRYSDT